MASIEREGEVAMGVMATDDDGLHDGHTDGQHRQTEEVII